MEVSSTSGNIYYTEQNQTNTDPSVLDKDAFLRILINQLRYQDPMNPQDSESFITQMVQLTTIEQLTNLTTSMERMLEAQEMNRAVSLLGREVVLAGDNDELVQGVVEKVITGGDQPLLSIGGQTYELERVLSVSTPPPVQESEPPAEEEAGSGTGDGTTGDSTTNDSTTKSTNGESV